MPAFISLNPTRLIFRFDAACRPLANHPNRENETFRLTKFKDLFL